MPSSGTLATDRHILGFRSRSESSLLQVRSQLGQGFKSDMTVIWSQMVSYTLFVFTDSHGVDSQHGERNSH